ncbi:single-stranded DNA-binding protein [Bifidobacterium primatium]|nr:single-stranded DNA-binding protein [Bifidobacterium primatium]
MAQQSQIVITGNVGKEPVRLGVQGGTPMCTFRLASTRSFWNRRTGQWQEGNTTWITVKAFRSLAMNIMQSVKKGDPVIVVGDLITDVWERDGAQRSSMAIEASHVGHDLNRGAGAFVRNQNGGGSSNGGDAERAAAGNGLGVGMGNGPDAGIGNGSGIPNNGVHGMNNDASDEEFGSMENESGLSPSP